MNKNTALDLMFKVDELRQRQKDLKGVAKTFHDENPILNEKIYMGLLDEVHRIQRQINDILYKLRLVGIKYE